MYDHKVFELKVALDSARGRLDELIESRGDLNGILSTMDRLTGLNIRADLCNQVIHRIKNEAGNSDVEPIVRRTLDEDKLSIAEMGAILLFAPEWSKTLVDAQSPNASSLYQVEFIRKSDSAVFYKIGHTGRPLRKRLTGFVYDKRLYTATIHHQILFAQKHMAAAEEARLHLANVEHRYDGEPFLANGHTEVYTEPLVNARLRLELSLYSLLGISRE